MLQTAEVLWYFKLPMQGLRHFFIEPPLATREFTIRGIGIREAMLPCLVDRPGGTGDWLFMFFHEPVQLAAQQQMLAQNTLVLWAPEHGHYYGNCTGRWRHSWIHCDGTFVRQLVEQLELPTAMPLLNAEPFVAERWLLALYQELTGAYRVDIEIAKSLFSIWLRDVQRRHCGRGGPRCGPPQRWTQLKNMLETSFTKRHSLTVLAEQFGVSPQHLSATFKRYFGVGPIDYVVRLRIAHARYLLRDQGLSVGEVAEQVGYDDLYQFSRLFKKHMGQSPTAVRRQFQREAESCVVPRPDTPPGR